MSREKFWTFDNKRLDGRYLISEIRPFCLQGLSLSSLWNSILGRSILYSNSLYIQCVNPKSIILKFTHELTKAGLMISMLHHQGNYECLHSPVGVTAWPGPWSRKKSYLDVSALPGVWWQYVTHFHEPLIRASPLHCDSQTQNVLKIPMSEWQSQSVSRNSDNKWHLGHHHWDHQGDDSRSDLIMTNY